MRRRTVNFKHIEASCKGEWLHSAKHGETRLLTNGHIMFPFTGEFEIPADVRDLPKAAELWAESLAKKPEPVEIGGLFDEGQHLCRKVGEVFVAERYMRCFGEGVTWTPTGKFDKPVLVHRDGELVGVVIGMKYAGKPNTDPEPTDVEVFAPFAGDENAWYLVDAKRLQSKLGQAREEMDELRDRLDEAQQDYDSASREVASLRARLAALGKPKAAESETEARCR